MPGGMCLECCLRPISSPAASSEQSATPKTADGVQEESSSAWRGNPCRGGSMSVDAGSAGARGSVVHPAARSERTEASQRQRGRYGGGCSERPRGGSRGGPGARRLLAPCGVKEERRRDAKNRSAPPERRRALVYPERDETRRALKLGLGQAGGVAFATGLGELPHVRQNVCGARRARERRAWRGANVGSGASRQKSRESRRETAFGRQSGDGE